MCAVGTILECTRSARTCDYTKRVHAKLPSSSTTSGTWRSWLAGSIGMCWHACGRQLALGMGLGRNFLEHPLHIHTCTGITNTVHTQAKDESYPHPTPPTYKKFPPQPPTPTPIVRQGRAGGGGGRRMPPGGGGGRRERDRYQKNWRRHPPWRWLMSPT